MNSNAKLFLCIPVLDEEENIRSFLEVLQNQETSFTYEAIFCVNQPHSWWENSDKRAVCERNQQTLDYLSQPFDFPVTVIDKSTQGWDEKYYGVGWARKTAMDKAAEKAENGDLIFSMDADTFYPPDYLEKSTRQLLKHPEKIALAIPYYHPLPEKSDAARAILHYEIYMRHYALNMWRINSPYRFTALGSAMAVKTEAYRKVGGITPKMAGEDFYFLQKLVKSGDILFYAPAKAYPMARFSDRVVFGTGPAMMKGASGQWDSYPIYHPSVFDEVAEIDEAFNHFYRKEEILPALEKMKIIIKNLDWLKKLKQNSKSEKEFLKKCHTYFDGLKTLQYLKQRQKTIPVKEEEVLSEYLLTHYPENALAFKEVLHSLDFAQSSIADLNNIRNLMTAIEDEILKES